MTPPDRQLELTDASGTVDAPRRRRRRRRDPVGLKGLPALVVRRVVFWAPVWMPALLLWQLAWVGLRPAQTEERLRARQAGEVQARVERLLDERTGLERDARALRDEVYRERVRRSLRQQGTQPLTLTGPRAGR